MLLRVSRFESPHPSFFWVRFFNVQIPFDKMKLLNLYYSFRSMLFNSRELKIVFSWIKYTYDLGPYICTCSPMLKCYIKTVVCRKLVLSSALTQYMPSRKVYYKTLVMCLNFYYNVSQGHHIHTYNLGDEQYGRWRPQFNTSTWRTYYSVSVFQPHVELSSSLQASQEQLKAFNSVTHQEQLVMKQVAIFLP